jgi:hypothetical protein
MAKQQNATADLDLTVPAEAKKSSTAMELATQAPKYLQRVNAMQVTNAAEHTQMIDLLRLTAAREKEVETERELINKPLHTAWKNSCDFFNRLAAPFEAVQRIGRKKAKDWEDAERAKAEKLRRENEAEAQRQRDRIAADAKEAQRIAEQKVEDARKEAARQLEAKKEAERKAKLLTDRGNHVAAAEWQNVAQQAGTAAAKAESKAERIETAATVKVENLQQQALTIVAPIVDAPALKVEGRKSRKVWKWKIKDASKIDRRFLMLDETKVNTLVRSMHKEAESLLGEGAIEVWEEDDLSITAAK